MRRKRSAMFGLLVALTPVVAACAGGTPVTAAQTATQTATATTSIKAAAPVPTATEALAATLPQTVPASQAATGGNQIRVVIGDAVLAGQLWDNATARDLLSQLPLTLTFSDFNGVEKIARLPQKLSTAGVPSGADPSPREIGYYAPWGDLVFYYGDVGYFDGIVRIGQFDGSMDAIVSQTGDFTATLELAN